MLIYTQNRDKVINSDVVSYFDLDLIGDGNSNVIYANFENDAPITLGVYTLQDDAKKVLDKLVQSYGGISVFYVPTEREMLNE